MAPFCRKHDNIIDQGLIPRDSEDKQEGLRFASVLGQRPTGHGFTSFSGIRTNPVHKASRCRFLTWVAYTRNFAPTITASQRSTCPMTGCELSFDHSELMLQHIRICPRLWKGAYRCFESGKEERIGKCDTEGCQELKGRIVTAVNSSLRSVKRHFSGRVSKSRQFVEHSLEKQVIPQEDFEMDSTWAQRPGFAELRFDGDASNPGMGITWRSLPQRFDQENSSFRLSELSVTDTSRYTPSNNICMQSFPSELGAGNDTVYFPQHGIQPPSTPAELDISVDISNTQVHGSHWREPLTGLDVSTVSLFSENTGHAQAEPAELFAGVEPAWMYGRLHQQNIRTILPSQSYTGERTDELQSYLPSAEPFVPLLNTNEPHHASRKTIQTLDTSETRDRIVVDEAACNPIHTNMYHAGIGSGTSSDAGMSRSVFSSISTMSTPHSSMSSLDSSNATLDDCYEISTPVFLGESNMIFEEPESIEPLTLPERDNHHPGSSSSVCRRTDSNGVSIDNYTQAPNIQHREYHLTNQNRSIKKRTRLSPPDNAAPLLADDKNQSPPSLILPPPLLQTSASRKVACRYCKFEPLHKDTSNLSRHERMCKSNPRRPEIKRFKCQYPGCRRAFTRADNLLVHQRAKNHLWTLEFRVQFGPTSLTPGLNTALDSLD